MGAWSRSRSCQMPRRSWGGLEDMVELARQASIRLRIGAAELKDPLTLRSESSVPSTSGSDRDCSSGPTRSKANELRCAARTLPAIVLLTPAETPETIRRSLGRLVFRARRHVNSHGAWPCG